MSDTINRLDKARVLLNLARADAADGHWPECIHDLQQIVRDLSALHNELRDQHMPHARGLPHIQPITTQLAHIPNRKREQDEAKNVTSVTPNIESATETSTNPIWNALALHGLIPEP